MRKIIALLLAVVMCLSLAACGSSDNQSADTSSAANSGDSTANGSDSTGDAASDAQEKVSLTLMNIWCGSDSKAEEWARIISDFNKEYAGVYEIVVEDQADYDAYEDKMKTLISTGNTPDLFTFKGQSLADFSASGKLMDLTAFVGGEDIAGRFKDGTFDGVDYNGSYYCIPYETAYIPLMYNQNLLTAAGAEVPTSYDELYAAAAKIADTGVYPITQTTGSNAWFSQLWFSYCLASVMGADIYNYAYDSAEWIEGAKLYTTLTEYSEPDIVGGTTSDANGNFFNERSAFYCNGTWICGRIASEGVEGLADSLTVGGTLSYNGKNGGGMMNINQGYIGAAASDDAAHVAAVEAFLEFITRSDEVLALSKSSGALFSVSYDESQLPEGLQTSILSAGNAASFTFDHVQNKMTPQVWAAYVENIDSLILGEMTAEEFCQALAAAAE